MKTLEAIQQSEAISAANTDALDQTYIPAVVIPKNSNLESLEHLALVPASFKARFSTQVLSEFTAYTKDQQTEEKTTVFIDIKNMAAQAIFDLGTQSTPDWCRHKADVYLEKTSAYEALLNTEQKRFSQDDLIDFFTDFKENLTFISEDGEKVSFQDAINRFRKLTITSSKIAEQDQGDFNTAKSTMEKVEASSGQERIPAGFSFKTIPHDGFDEQSINARVRIAIRNEELFIIIRIEAKERLTESIANEFRDKLKDSLKETNIYIGTMDAR